jgi:hypothetical protein
MGIRLQNSALTNALMSLRTSGIAPAIPIEYAASNQPKPGTTFFETAQQLATYIGNAGWDKTQEIRVQWAASPQPPLSLVNEVRTTLNRATQGLGARAFTAGDSPAFGDTPSNHTAAHEAIHVVQQR